MCNFQVGASETVEVVISSSAVTSRKFNFPQNLNVVENDAEILCIEAYSADEIPKSPLGKDVVSAAVLKSCFLSLKKAVSGAYMYKQVPIQDLIVSKNNGQKELLQPVMIDFSQSEIDVAQGVTLVADTVFLFRIIYRKKQKC
jgi:hypothetical protein